MKQWIEIFKNFTPQQWLNIIFATILAFSIHNYQKRIERLEEDIRIASEHRTKLFELYQECLINKNKEK